jgi:hypothetical protein
VKQYFNQPKKVIKMDEIPKMDLEGRLGKRDITDNYFKNILRQSEP